MEYIYQLRDRYAVPAIVALLAATLIAIPLQSLLVPEVLGHQVQAGLVRPGLLLTLFAGLLAPLALAWQRWLSRRPTLVVLPGGRKRAGVSHTTRSGGAHDTGAPG